jgi:uncharacterized membrane protein YoaK (UPF0700 family)
MEQKAVAFLQLIVGLSLLIGAGIATGTFESSAAYLVGIPVGAVGGTVAVFGSVELVQAGLPLREKATILFVVLLVSCFLSFGVAYFPGLTSDFCRVCNAIRW